MGLIVTWLAFAWSGSPLLFALVMLQKVLEPEETPYLGSGTVAGVIGVIAQMIVLGIFLVRAKIPSRRQRHGRTYPPHPYFNSGIVLLCNEITSNVSKNNSQAKLEAITTSATVTLPLLVLVGGKPGTGKSTLAQHLARPEHLGLPLLSRDAIKVGLVETYALANPTAAREVVESDASRSIIVPASFALFHDTISLWLRAGVSLIAEYGFKQRSEPALRPITQLARTVFVVCHASPTEARRRYIERERRDPRHRPDRLATMLERISQGTDPWSVPDSLELDVPTLYVDTIAGYKPALDEITRFCREAMLGESF